MSKIICDVCGTSYQDTAQCCPICGCTPDEAASLMNDELMIDEMLSEPAGRGNMLPPKKKREIFDFDEVNGSNHPPVDSVEDPYDEDEDEEFDEDAPSHNTFAVILLTVLIAMLLLAAAFLFVRFYLPGITGKEEAPAPVITQPAETQPVPTTELTIPCESLALTSGMPIGDAALVKPGQKFLIHVIASPEDTTDVITYTSADESVATVTADGQIEAVGEGETVINIVCGDYQIPCKVLCSFVEETEPTTEATTEPTVPETTLPEVELKLKGSDYTLSVGKGFQLMLDCDLKQTDVEWSAEHSHIVSVDEEGNVKALKSGTTSVIAKYGDQTVSCIIRCRG